MPKKRIFQVAKELNISHVDIMKFLKENDIKVSSHMAPLEDDVYEMILSEFNKERLEINRLRKEQARQAIITSENEINLQHFQNLKDVFLLKILFDVHSKNLLFLDPFLFEYGQVL